MSGVLVIDASVAVAWVIEEPISPQADALLTSGEALIAPDLLVAELGNALWKAERRGTVHPLDALRASALVERAISEWQPALPLLPAASAFARELNHPIYDCFYLALAQREGAAVATADARMAALCAQKAIPARLIVPPQPSASSA